MAENYSVAISYKGALGWVELDEAAHTVIVNLDEPEGKKLAEDYLAATHTIRVPGETLLDFHAEEIVAKDSRRSFELAMTRMWEATEVHVDWSRPVDYVKAHPHY
ncbi:MAG: hypothetical protein Q4D07_06465 [Selenomonadaceae bacterium]|nr:hypothetical protein [Selenomonadaceae bacterium]